MHTFRLTGVTDNTKTVDSAGTSEGVLCRANAAPRALTAAPSAAESSEQHATGNSMQAAKLLAGVGGRGVAPQ